MYIVLEKSRGEVLVLGSIILYFITKTLDMDYFWKYENEGVLYLETKMLFLFLLKSASGVLPF